jgi:hypothetical protein
MATQTINRPGDITIRICSNCGNQIHGEYEQEFLRGIRKYRHPYACDGEEYLNRFDDTGEVQPRIQEDGSCSR